MPGKEKKYSRTFPIQEYLYRMVSKSSPDRPERLPSERDISRDFDVARTTVRNAIAEVEASGSVIRLPGKKGLFTNPERSHPDMKFIALIFLQGVCAALSSWMASLFAETHKELNMTELYYQTVTIPEHFSTEDSRKYLMQQNYDAFAWFFPTEEFHPLIQDLLDRHFPLTVFGEHSILPKTHPALIFPDHTELYRYLTAECIGKKYTHPAMVFWDSQEAGNFKSALAQGGIQHFSHFPDDGPAFQKAIREEPFDFIFSPCPVLKAREILNILRSSPCKNAEIVMTRDDSTRNLCREYSSMNLLLIPKEIRERILQKMGKSAARSIQLNLNGKA